MDWSDSFITVEGSIILHSVQPTGNAGLLKEEEVEAEEDLGENKGEVVE